MAAAAVSLKSPNLTQKHNKSWVTRLERPKAQRTELSTQAQRAANPKQGPGGPRQRLLFPIYWRLTVKLSHFKCAVCKAPAHCYGFTKWFPTQPKECCHFSFAHGWLAAHIPCLTSPYFLLISSLISPLTSPYFLAISSQTTLASYPRPTAMTSLNMYYVLHLVHEKDRDVSRVKKALGEERQRKARWSIL